MDLLEHVRENDGTGNIGETGLDKKSQNGQKTRHSEQEGIILDQCFLEFQGFILAEAPTAEMELFEVQTGGTIDLLRAATVRITPTAPLAEGTILG